MEKLNSWLALLANIGVLIGIGFLVVEIDQTNSIAAVSFNYEQRHNFSSINEAIMTDPEFAQFLKRMNESVDEIEGADHIRLTSFIFRLHNAWLGGLMAYEEGVMNERDFQTLLEDAEATIAEAGPAQRLVWRQVLDNYPSLANTKLWQALYRFLDEVPFLPSHHADD